MLIVLLNAIYTTVHTQIYIFIPQDKKSPLFHLVIVISVPISPTQPLHFISPLLDHVYKKFKMIKTLNDFHLQTLICMLEDTKYAK